jgi:hypothetical protein
MAPLKLALLFTSTLSKSEIIGFCRVIVDCQRSCTLVALPDIPHEKVLPYMLKDTAITKTLIASEIILNLTDFHIKRLTITAHVFKIAIITKTNCNIIHFLL